MEMGQKYCKKPKDQEDSWETVLSMQDKEAAAMKSQQYGTLNKT